MYTVTLTNDSMPFRDDSNYDKKEVTIFKKSFEQKKEAAKFFKEYAQQNGMRIFYSEASGNAKKLYRNF